MLKFFEKYSEMPKSKLTTVQIAAISWTIFENIFIYKTVKASSD